MNQPTNTSPSALSASAPLNKHYWLWGALLIALGLIFFTYWSGLSLMVRWWEEQEEYSHGYMIPFVAIFLLWQRINAIPKTAVGGSWWGVLLLIMGLLCFFLGELSAIYTFIQYGFLISLAAIAWSFFGSRTMILVWAAFFYLIFMIPLPNFLYFNLSSQLQLLSSVIGVAFIRLFDISVNLEGNVIDLGAMQLQVAEACSGLRYLFPLMSFGFLICYLYRGPLWQRFVIFFSTIPITVLMNSFRIGVIGITVDKWGIKMAQGFLHDFEGWVVFMGCVGILFLEIALFRIFSSHQHKPLDLINLEIPKLSIKLSDFKIDTTKQRPFLVGFVLLLLTTPYFSTLSERVETPPSRQSFVNFPLTLNGWSGQEGALEKNIIDTLQFSDYITADYRNESDPVPVNFYSAWYASQKKGASIHSPRSCIPGGGWRIERLEQINVPNVTRANGQPLRINRALIQKGDTINVVYYWFDGRGRDITNEYMAKWYVFWDSLTRSRSDGALVRVVTGASNGASVEAADQRLQHFLQDFYPSLTSYIP